MSEKIPIILNGFLIYLTTIKGKSKRTRIEYRYDLILMFKFIKSLRNDLSIKNIQEIDISDINEDFIKEIYLEELYEFLEFCQEVRNNNAITRARKVASIKSFFKYMYTKKKFLNINPAEELESPKISKRTPIYMTLEETQVFLTGIKQNKHYYRNTCIMFIFLNCGLRIAELCGINLPSIQNNILTVIGKGDKERQIYLNQICILSLNEYIKKERNLLKNIKDTEALFISQKGTRLDRRTIEKLVITINHNSGLNKYKLSPHKLRHTMATLLYKASNGDIRSLQQILGHESISTTQIYTHVNNEQIRNVMEINPLNKLNLKK